MDRYSNDVRLHDSSRLPPTLESFCVCPPTWSLACLGARASLAVYDHHTDRYHGFIHANTQKHTKAMLIEVQQLGCKYIVVVAVRGTGKSLADWRVNLRSALSQPSAFIDDDSNACHEGFLLVARSMVAIAANEIRKLLQPGRRCYLLFTGHSAGGAIASLLYVHMRSSSTSSQLTALAGRFRRIHCITFGTPPISILPLTKPRSAICEKDLFLTFVNEGDFVTRLDSLAYVTSSCQPATLSFLKARKRNKFWKVVSFGELRLDGEILHAIRKPRVAPTPEAALSVPGQLVLLRQEGGEDEGDIEAAWITDSDLRSAFFTQLKRHRMSLYRSRVEKLAADPR